MVILHLFFLTLRIYPYYLKSKRVFTPIVWRAVNDVDFAMKRQNCPCRFALLFWVSCDFSSFLVKKMLKQKGPTSGLKEAAPPGCGRRPVSGPQEDAPPARNRNRRRSRRRPRVPPRVDRGQRPGRTKPRLPCVGMDSDRIRTDTNADVTIYHILFRIRIRIRILSNTNTKQIFRIRIHIRILTRFTA
jgi:hypothetical protein